LTIEVEDFEKIKPAILEQSGRDAALTGCLSGGGSCS